MRNLLRLRLPGTRRLRLGVLAPALVLVLVAAGMTLGRGLASHSVNSGYDLAWLGDDTSGQVVQIDPISGTANMRMQVAAPGHPLQIEQGDGHLVIVDKRTGKITTIDLSTLLVGGSRAGAAGSAAQVLLAGSRMYVANLDAGSVQAVDPATEASLGKPWRAGHPLIDVGLDGAHNVWALDSTNRLVSLDWSAQRQTLVPTSTHTVTGAGPGSVIIGHDKGVTVVGGHGGVLRVGTGNDTTLSAPAVKGPLAAPQQSPADLVPVAAPSTSSVLIVSKKGVVVDDVAPLGCTRPGTPAAFHDKIYVPCDGAHKVIVLGRDGKRAGPPVATGGTGNASLVIAAGRLLINVPGAGSVKIVDGSGTTVQVPTGSRTTGVHNPTEPPPTPPPPPPVTTPSTHKNNNGGGSGRDGRGGVPDATHPTGARKGGEHGNPDPGPGSPTTNPSAPVPNVTGPGTPTNPPPTGAGTAQAEAQPDGSVLVDWRVKDSSVPATGYVVDLAGSDGNHVASVGAGSSSATVTVLDPGTSAAFVVRAMADDHEIWSATTGVVTTYARPGAVSGVSVTSSKVTSGKVTLTVTWQPADANGAAVIYSASASGAKAVTTQNTSAQLTLACGSGCSGRVTVGVRNAAGDGTSGSGAYTVADPTPPPTPVEPPADNPPTAPEQDPVPAPPAGGATFVSVTGTPTPGNTGGVNPHPAQVALSLTVPASWATWVSKAHATCVLQDQRTGSTATQIAVPCTSSQKTLSYTLGGTHEYWVVATGSNGSVASGKATATITVYHTIPCPDGAGAVPIAGSGGVYALPQCNPPCTDPTRMQCPRPRSAGESALPSATIDEFAWLVIDVARSWLP